MSGAALGASSTGRDHADPDLSHPGTVIPQLAGAQQAELLMPGDQISLKGARETQILLCSKRFIKGLFFSFLINGKLSKNGWWKVSDGGKARTVAGKCSIISHIKI